jgi:hypothetical protein
VTPNFDPRDMTKPVEREFVNGSIC